MEKILIEDNDDLVTCRICGGRHKRLYGKHFTVNHKITSKQYKEMFPGAPIMCKNDMKKTTLNSGKHMKEDRYKQMFREKVLGEKNPNHRSRTTEQERKSRSPFSKQFIGYFDIENKEDHISKFVKESLKDRITSTQKEYYIKKGFSEEDATKLLSDRQKTFSLEKCIEKYGEEQGHKRWSERQSKWQKNLLENGNLKCGYSSISQELFYEIITYYKNKSDLMEVYFATKNKEYFINTSDSFFSYDFVDINRKKIIEYNGDNYHANPNRFSENDYPHPFNKKLGFSSKEIWNRDNQKKLVAESKGFEILVIWDSEFKKNKSEIIHKCLHFLEIETIENI
jgi:hypothetical protein